MADDDVFPGPCDTEPVAPVPGGHMLADPTVPEAPPPAPPTAEDPLLLLPDAPACPAVTVDGGTAKTGWVKINPLLAEPLATFSLRSDLDCCSFDFDINVELPPALLPDVITQDLTFLGDNVFQGDVFFDGDHVSFAGAEVDIDLSVVSVDNSSVYVDLSTVSVADTTVTVNQSVFNLYNVTILVDQSSTVVFRNTFVLFDLDTVSYKDTEVFVGVNATFFFGVSVSLSVSPTGVLVLPVIAVDGKPTYTGKKKGEVVCTGKNLWQWDGSAWAGYKKDPTTTKGDLFYRDDGEDWQRLPPGSAGTVLTSNGPASAPSYQAPASGSVGGSGTATKIPLWSGSTTLTDSAITQAAGILKVDQHQFQFFNGLWVESVLRSDHASNYGKFTVTIWDNLAVTIGSWILGYDGSTTTFNLTGTSPAFAVNGTPGGSATTGGLTFSGGLYLSGTASAAPSYAGSFLLMG